MKRRTFVKTLALTGTVPFLTASIFDKNGTDHIRLLRHATLILQLNGKKFLVDPMLSAKGEMDPIQNCGNDIRIPIVDLPIDSQALAEILKGIDTIVVTHTHRDHWDAAAQKLIDKNKPIFCQPVDVEKIKGQGFLNVTAVGGSVDWNGIAINRTKGKHGTGDIGQRMGEVSGFVFKTKSKSVYVAGDTIWCDDVKEALATYQPSVTVLNAGGARFLTGDPITMTPEDVMNVHAQLPATRIIAVHMDTVNHCFVKRGDLKKVLKEKKLKTRVSIPKDGELIHL